MSQVATKPRARKRTDRAAKARRQPPKTGKRAGGAAKAPSAMEGRIGQGGRRLADAFEAVSIMPVLAESRRRLLVACDGGGSSPAEVAEAIESDAGLTVAVLRAFDASEFPLQMLQVLRQLRHPLWSPQSPKGFGDTTQEWADPDSLLNRAELARTLGRRMAPSDPDAFALEIAGPAFQWR